MVNPTIGAPTATLVLAGAVVLTCPLAASGTPPYTSYQLQRSPDNVTFSNIGAGNIQRNFTDTTVSASTTYYYRITVTDSASLTGTSTSISITTPSATAGNTIQWLPTEISHAQTLAAANDAVQWQPFKSQLDSYLNSVVSGVLSAAYEGSDLHYATDYALGYAALNATDPTTAQKYADKAIGCMLNAVTGIQRTVYSTILYNARGDGTTTVFTIPNSDYVASSLRVYTLPVATVAVAKGTANGQDSTGSVGQYFIKVSNTPDGTANYIKDTDWRQNTFDYQETNIDWSLAQNQPATITTTLTGAIGATDTTINVTSTTSFPASGTIQINSEKINYAGTTPTSFTGCTRGQYSTGPTTHTINSTVNNCYYITYVDVSSAGSQATGFTVAGTTVTFTTAPSTTKAVCFEYVYGTHTGSTLAYQQTTGSLGGLSNAMVDGPGYATRWLQCVAQAVDLLWNYTSFTWALKAQVCNMMVKWSDWIRDNAFNKNVPDSNYGAAHIAMRTAIAIALKNREAQNASRLQTEVTNYYTNYIQPTLVAPSGTTGTNKDGFWGEGWNYGGFAIQNLVKTALGASEIGFYTPTDIQAWTNDVIRALLLQQPTQTTICDFGDGYAYPEPFVSKATLYLLAYYNTDATLKSYANYAIQNYSGSVTQDFNFLLFYKPSATAVNWGSNLPLAYKFSGTGLIVTRKQWDYASPIIFFHSGNLGGGAHAPYGEGSYEIRYGNDDLIPLVEALTETQSIQKKSQYGSNILIDDFGAGYMTYPSTSGGPAMGVWYTAPNGCTINQFENTTNYTYWTSDYGAAYGKNYTGTPNPTTELNRSQFYIRGASTTDYFITHDRVTTVQAGFLKQFQFPINKNATIVQNGTSVTITQGTSKLFSTVFSDVPLTTALNTVSVNSTNDSKQFTAVPTTNNATKINYRTAMQISPSTVTNADTFTDIPSADTISEGTMIGNTVVMFGRSGTIANTTNYNISVGNGTTITHYVTDLQPSTTYNITGANQASANTTSAGVLTFTTTGTGSSQNITLAVSGSSIPPTPTGLVASPGNTQVSLSWNAVTGATTYNIYRSTSSGTEILVHSGIATNSYVDTGLTNNTTYYYKVSAVNANGESALSTEASVTPLGSAPAAPTGLTATAGSASVSLSWTASTGATSYNIYRSTSSGTETLLTAGVTITSYNNSGLTNGTTYFYKVSAVNSGGESTLSTEVSATPAGSVPSAPTNLNATAGNSLVNLTWSSVIGAQTYNIYRSTTTGNEVLIQTGDSVPNFSNTGLTNGVTYFYKVSAVNTNGESILSSEVSATPQDTSGYKVALSGLSGLTGMNCV